MFAKLLKHELRATGTTMGWLSLAAVGLGVLGAVVLRILVTYGDALEASGSAAVLVPMLLVLGLFVVYIGLMGYAIGGGLFVLLRFYRNKFTDQGYLTFTLPVTAHQIFLSSWALILIWDAVITVVTIFSFALIFLVGTATEGLLNQTVLELFAEELPNLFRITFSEMMEIAGPAFLYMIVGGIIQLLTAPLISMTSIVLGSSVAKKHKLLASIAFYYGLQVLSNMVMTMVTGAAAVGSVIGGGDESTVMSIFFLQPMLYLGFGIGAYFLSTHLMGKKLNLA